MTAGFGEREVTVIQGLCSAALDPTGGIPELSCLVLMDQAPKRLRSGIDHQRQLSFNFWTCVMKLFSCDACGRTLYFHNVACTQCGHRLGFVPDSLDLIAIEVAENRDWQPRNTAGKTQTFRPCGTMPSPTPETGWCPLRIRIRCARHVA